MLIYTIGHSSRTLDEFQKLLQQYRIELLLDVRTVPKSRHVPHFNSDSLQIHHLTPFAVAKDGLLTYPKTSASERLI